MNINSLLPKNDELRETVKISKPTVMGIAETKLDNSIRDSEISNEEYCAIWCDQNRKGGDVVCHVTNKICYNTENFISNEIVNIFVELLIPKIKPITTGIVYKSPEQIKFLEKLSNSLSSLNKLREEWHILGDLYINLDCYYGSTLGEENKNIIKGVNKVSSETKNYLKFCKSFGLKQLIKSPTRVTPYTSTLIDHIWQIQTKKLHNVD